MTATDPYAGTSGPVLTYVEGLAVVARYRGDVPVVIRLATDADRETFAYRPDPRALAAQRAAWDRLAANGG